MESNDFIPETVTYIGDRAFDRHKSIETKNMPETLTRINLQQYTKVIKGVVAMKTLPIFDEMPEGWSVIPNIEPNTGIEKIYNNLPVSDPNRETGFLITSRKIFKSNVKSFYRNSEKIGIDKNELKKLMEKEDEKLFLIN